MSANQTASLDLEGVSRRFGDRVVLSDVFRAGDGRRTYAVLRLRAVTEEMGES